MGKTTEHASGGSGAERPFRAALLRAGAAALLLAMATMPGLVESAEAQIAPPPASSQPGSRSNSSLDSSSPAGSLVNADFKNPSLPFERRVADLIKRFTLEEKAQQCQMAVAPNTRLGILGINWWTEGIHGIARNGRATAFPQAIGMSASWDPALLGKIAAAIADEARAKYEPRNTGGGGERSAYRGITVWAPTVNMDRDPRWGRSEETYGEDPYLTSRLAVEFCKGLQGDDPKYLKTVATPKHFALHSQETGRHDTSFEISERTLREYYLPAFEACVHEGGATSIMTAYNGINGIPCMADSWLLTDLLRGEWGFQGAVVSDYRAPGMLLSGHRYVNTPAEIASASINAGCDVLCDTRSYANEVVAAVQQGLLKESVLDQSLARNLMLRFRLGMFDPPEMVPYSKMPPGTVGSKEHIQLALQMARESIVLLQNNAAPPGYGFQKLLPLDLRRISSIAVVGPYANVCQYGNYTPNQTAGASLTPIAALKAAVGDRVVIRGQDAYDAESAARAAAASDIAIVVVGLNQQLEFEGVDRYTLDLPLDQRQLVEKVVKANPLTIVVLEGGGPIGCTWFKEHVPAILMSFYPGEQGGNALAEILLGQTNPSGKLTVTFYRDLADVPKQSDYEISKGRTYMYLQKPPCFAFGHGLSYSQFTYANLRLKSPAIAQNGSLLASVDISNSGPFDGDEIVQLYVHKMHTAIPGPPPAIKQLKGFQRIALTQGQTRTVEFTVPAKDLYYWDDKERKFATEPGAYQILIGAASDDIRQRAEFSVLP